MDDVGELVTAARTGEPAAVERLFRATYDDLKQLARQRLRRSPSVTVLDTTALVHECYMRLTRVERIGADDRAFFLGYAARAMRSIVIDMLRARAAVRRGGDAPHVTLSGADSEQETSSEDELLRVNDALEELQTLQPRLVQIVEMKFFAGMTFDEIGGALGMNERTARRDWQKARLLLRLSLGD